MKKSAGAAWVEDLIDATILTVLFPTLASYLHGVAEAFKPLYLVALVVIAFAALVMWIFTGIRANQYKIMLARERRLNECRRRGFIGERYVGAK